MSTVPERIAALSPAKRALLARRVSAGRVGRTAPLSFAQEGVWFLHQLDPQSPVFNMSVSVRLRGTLDEDALQWSLDQMAARHGILRTVYPSIEDRPLQVVNETGTVRLTVIDVQAARRVADAVARALVGRPFALTDRPPFAAAVLRLGPREHVLVLLLHHIAGDERSLELLIRELTILYDGRCAGRPPLLPPPTAQYAEYATWQRDRSAVLHEQLAAWKHDLAGLATLDLPADVAGARRPSFEGTSRPITWPVDLRDSLHELARARGVTLYTLMLAALQALLHRYTGQDEIAVGVAMSGRDRPELEGLVGLVANVLVLRGDVSGDPTFVALLDRTRQTMVAALARQEVPFQWLVRELRTDADPTIDSLVQVAFHLTSGTDGSVAPQRIAGLEVSPIETDQEVSRFQLAFGLRESPRGIHGHVFYRTDMFSADTIEQLVDCWRTMLTAIAADPSRTISSLPLVSHALQQRLEQGPHTGVDSPTVTVHQRVAQLAQETPTAIAITCGATAIDYRGLQQRAARIAQELRRSGVRPQDAVAVFAPRGIDYVAALLGILQAGAVYVPLDPEYPAQRLQFMVESARPVVTLTGTPMPADVAASAGRVIDLMAIAPSDGPTAAIAEVAVLPEHPAYIIYTSGSTGRPKGVIVSHASLAHTMRGVQDVFAFTAADTILCTASFAFDISLFEVLSALLAGGRLFLLPDRPLLSDAEWHAVLREVTLVHGTPSLLRQIVDAARRVAPVGAFPHVRQLMVGGDAVPPALVEAMAATFPQGDVYIGYGPTEAAMVCSLYRVQRDHLPERHIIGRPLRDVIMRVADRYQNTLPAGARGELLLGGPGIAIGYLDDADATAERFPTIGGTRFHKSGDMARYLPDGVIESLGRIDTQVKVRGHRIDLAEIEAALGEHPDVHGAAVTVFDGPSGETALAAYVVSRSRGASDASIRALLRSRLPAFMEPAAIVMLPALPLTATGKVDRRALPTPSIGATGALYVAPSTDAERTLTSVCGELLNLPSVGVGDSFFALGGDSILAIQFVARVREHGLRLTPRQLFEHRTIAELAAVTEPVARTDGGGGTGRGRLPVVGGQAWVLETQPATVRDQWNQAVVVETATPISGARVAAAVATVTQRHEALRLRVAAEAGGWEQWIAPAAGGDVTEVDLTALPVARRASAVERGGAALQRRLSVTAGPVLRVAAWQGVTTGTVLTVVVHHLAVDGVSWQVLLEDLETACQQAAVAPAVRGLTWSGWVRAAQAGMTQVASTASYWTETATRATRAAAVWGAPRGTVAQARTETVVVRDAAAQALLEELPARCRARVEESLLAVLARAVTQVAGTAELGVMLEGTGRTGGWVVGDASRTVGWLATRYPLWVSVPADGIGAVVAAVKTQWRQVPHEGESYAALRYLGAPAVRAALTDAGTPALGFTYLGRLTATLDRDRFFRRSRLSPGRSRHPSSLLPDVVELTASWFEGALRLEWTYADGSIDAARVRSLIAAYGDALDALVAWVQDPDAAVALVTERDTEYDEMDATLSELDEPAEDLR